MGVPALAVANVEVELFNFHMPRSTPASAKLNANVDLVSLTVFLVSCWIQLTNAGRRTRITSMIAITMGRTNPLPSFLISSSPALVPKPYGGLWSGLHRLI